MSKENKYKEQALQLMEEVTLVRPVGYVSKESSPMFVYPEPYVNYTFGKVLTALEGVGVITEKGKSVQSDALRSLLHDAFWGSHSYDYAISMLAEDLAAHTMRQPVEFGSELINEIKKF